MITASPRRHSAAYAINLFVLMMSVSVKLVDASIAPTKFVTVARLWEIVAKCVTTECVKDVGSCINAMNVTIVIATFVKHHEVDIT